MTHVAETPWSPRRTYRHDQITTGPTGYWMLMCSSYYFHQNYMRRFSNPFQVPARLHWRSLAVGWTRVPGDDTRNSRFSEFLWPPRVHVYWIKVDQSFELSIGYCNGQSFIQANENVVFAKVGKLFPFGKMMSEVTFGKLDIFVFIPNSSVPWPYVKTQTGAQFSLES